MDYLLLQYTDGQNRLFPMTEGKQIKGSSFNYRLEIKKGFICIKLHH